METFLGIDCGTQSTKILVYNPHLKKAVARAHAPHSLIQDASGKREQDAAWWTDALQQCLQSIGPSIRSSIKAIGVSGQQHGFVPIDKNGNVLRPVKLWCDTATSKECEEITDLFGGTDRLLNEVGNLISPGFTASKILWFKKNHPDLYRQLKTITLPHDYLNFVLTGERKMEWGDASGTGLLNIRTRQWMKDLIKLLDSTRDLSACLPELINSDQPNGALTKEAAQKFGLPEGILVSSGGGDNMMAAIGVGCNIEGDLTMSLGTSGTLFGYSDKPVIDPEGNLAAFCSSTGGWLPLLCTMNCTVATELNKTVWGTSLSDMELAASKAKPGSDGVVTLPFYNGERTPNLPNGRGCIMGLTPTNYNQENIFRSAMESALFGLKLGLASFTKLGFSPRTIKLTGGGAKSRLWRQMAADIFNLPIQCPVEEEAAAFGGALQAMWAFENFHGRKTSLNQILKDHCQFESDKQHEPQNDTVKEYADVYENYKRYVESVQPLFK